MSRIESKEGLAWIVEDDENLGALLMEELEDAGLQVRRLPSAEDATKALERQWPDLIICDLKLPGMDGLSFLKQMIAKTPEAAPGFLMITAFGTIPKAVEALKAGADDFLAKPLDLEHFGLAVKRILEKKRLEKMVKQMRGFIATKSFHQLFGESVPMRRLFAQILQVAKAQGPVLILGESGTGKELVARAIHQESNAASGPFLPVNCAGIPENLLESEFFGHAEGAFTGAAKGRRGLFAEAEGGSILLDEISEMPLSLQAKLLRILQDGKLRRVGENKETQLKVRILAATHRNLDEAVASGCFREDLFFRLETFTLVLPPLRERGEDIELLAARFLQAFSLSLDKKIKGFSADALDLINRYPFPGNVRELKNAIERAVTFADGGTIRVADLPARIRRYAESREEILPMPVMAGREKEDFLPLAEIERRYIRHVLAKVGGNKRQAAAILDIGRRTLYRRLGQEHTDDE
jgi:two-component system, NtrC family, response regulator AtoC